MSEEQRFEKIEKRLDLVEHSLSDYSATNIKDKYELKELIRTAVSEGNDKMMALIKDHEDRLIILEHSDATKALERTRSVSKTVATVIITFLVTLLLNNIVITVTNANSTNEENKRMEVQDGK